MEWCEHDLARTHMGSFLGACRGRPRGLALTHGKPARVAAVAAEAACEPRGALGLASYERINGINENVEVK